MPVQALPIENYPDDRICQQHQECCWPRGPRADRGEYAGNRVICHEQELSMVTQVPALLVAEASVQHSYRQGDPLGAVVRLGWLSRVKRPDVHAHPALIPKWRQRSRSPSTHSVSVRSSRVEGRKRADASFSMGLHARPLWLRTQPGDRRCRPRCPNRRTWGWKSQCTFLDRHSRLRTSMYEFKVTDQRP